MTKLVKETKNKITDEKDTITLLLEYMVTFFSLVLVIFLPVYLKEGFYKIGDVKYTLYANITKLALPVLMGMIVLYFICNFKKWNVQRVLKNLSMLDYMVIGYMLFVLLSSDSAIITIKYGQDIPAGLWDCIPKSALYAFTFCCPDMHKMQKRFCFVFVQRQDMCISWEY